MKIQENLIQDITISIVRFCTEKFQYKQKLNIEKENREEKRGMIKFCTP